MGKTTIAKAIFNTIHYNFDGSTFLDNVRERSKTNDGILQLQEKIKRLHHKKSLVVLDDVEKLDEIDKFFENYDWFASGSRIVITTRDRHLLARYFSKRLACNVLQG